MKKVLSVLLAVAIIIACAPAIPLQVDAATSGYYTYEVSNGEATITDCNESISGAITIPATLGGYPVTSIGFYAFYNCSSLTSVTIPDSVASIGSSAFSNCSRLKSVVIGDSVASIGNYAFYNCKSLTSIEIPDSVTSIGDEAFHYCTRLTSVIIGNGVISIGNYAFKYCTSLTSVTIPDSVTSIGDEAFVYCKLTDITIPGSVTSIGYAAFAQCDDLINVVIEDGVTSIGKSAFNNSDNLASLTIPDSVTSIGDYVFIGCDSLTDVYYAGTQEQWNKITIGNYNVELAIATIHYNHIHDYSLIPSVKVDATCTEAGHTLYTCVYGEAYKRILTILGHDYSGAVTVVAPTCTEQGYTETQCTRCTETKKTNYTAALGHNCPSVEMVKEPTCTVKGITTGQCTNCGATIQGTIAELGHKMVAVPAVDATCTTDGTTVGTKCERCDYYGVTPTTIPATGHSFADGACTGCGLEGVALHKQDDVETCYNTLEEALAVTGGTIQLLADVTADVVNLNVGVTLDLNGYTLTADSVSGKVMDSKDGEGLVKTGAQNAVLSSNDDQLILWDNATGNAGYRVFNYTFTNMGRDVHKNDESESAKYGATIQSVWSDLTFTNPYAYTLVASTNSGLQVGFQLSWTPDGGTKASETFGFGSSVVTNWALAEEGNAGDKNYCFYIRVTGFEDLLTSGMVEVKPVLMTAFNSAETAVTEIRHNYVESHLGVLEFEPGFGIAPEM